MTKAPTVPKAIREQVWLRYFGETFKDKCWVPWCVNEITAFSFHVGHNRPWSQGGTLSISNLRPICARCNHSMGAQYTITKWAKLGA